MPTPPQRGQQHTTQGRNARPAPAGTSQPGRHRNSRFPTPGTPAGNTPPVRPRRTPPPPPAWDDSPTALDDLTTGDLNQLVALLLHLDAEPPHLPPAALEPPTLKDDTPPMPASRAQQAATAQRRAQAVAMRLAGLDFQTIADRLGYASRGAAHTDITRALEQNVAEMHRNADVLRQEELSRLDRLQAGAWAAAAAGDVKAIQAVLGIIDRRCKLLGLDAPIRHEVVTLDAIDNAIRQLNAELGRDQAGEAAGVAPAG